MSNGMDVYIDMKLRCWLTLCIQDRRGLTAADLHEPPPLSDLTQRPVRFEDEDDEPTGIRAGSSAKIDQLVHLLQLTPGGEKSLVFSQFTSFLDKVRIIPASPLTTVVLTTTP